MMDSKFGRFDLIQYCYIWHNCIVWLQKHFEAWFVYAKIQKAPHFLYVFLALETIRVDMQLYNCINVIGLALCFVL